MLPPRTRQRALGICLQMVGWSAAALAGYEKLDATIKQTLQGRAEALTEAHRRIRQAVSLKVRGLTVKPQLPPDLLGLLVLQPLVEEDTERRDAETRRH